MEIEPVELRGGERVWIRAVRHTDAAELQRAFALLSEVSRYRRFLTGTPRMSNAMARYFTTVDHVDHEALVALPSPRSDRIVGVARYIRHRERPTAAELAVTIADRWQDLGLGTALVRLLSARARAAGIDRFTVDMLEANEAVRALVAAAGGEISGQDGSVISGQIELGPLVVSLLPPLPETDAVQPRERHR